MRIRYACAIARAVHFDLERTNPIGAHHRPFAHVIPQLPHPVAAFQMQAVRQQQSGISDQCDVVGRDLVQVGILSR